MSCTFARPPERLSSDHNSQRGGVVKNRGCPPRSRAVYVQPPGFVVWRLTKLLSCRLPWVLAFAGTRLARIKRKRSSTSLSQYRLWSLIRPWLLKRLSRLHCRRKADLMAWLKYCSPGSLRPNMMWPWVGAKPASDTLGNWGCRRQAKRRARLRCAGSPAYRPGRRPHSHESQ